MGEYSGSGQNFQCRSWLGDGSVLQGFPAGEMDSFLPPGLLSGARWLHGKPHGVCSSELLLQRFLRPSPVAAAQLVGDGGFVKGCVQGQCSLSANQGSVG